ncbi:MAG: hypothetical protein RQ750_00865 [Roseovarius sp.]|nr:hypothetical protein [Roseovarius sp.]
MAEKKKTSKGRAEADKTPERISTLPDVDLTSEDLSPDQAAALEAEDQTAPLDISVDVTEDLGEDTLEGGVDDAPASNETSEPDQAPKPEQDQTQEPEIVTDEAPVSEPSSMVTTEQVVVRQGGFWSMVLGGIVAAGIGAVAAPYVLPPDWFQKGDGALDARIEQALGAQDQRINALDAQIDGMAVPPDRVDEINGLGETLTALTGQISVLEDRIVALENRPVPAPGAGVPSEELEDLRAALDTQRAEIAALGAAEQERASAAQQGAIATLRRAAMTRVLTALDSGSDFTSALADLRSTGAEVPAALADMAETGVPTMAALMQSFPEAARAALAAARGQSGQGSVGIGSFFKNQLGVRSLLPREGDDPDAVLSRIEAATGDGRLGDALAEIETLPDVAKDKLSDWATQVTRRKEALAAAEALAGTLN